LSEYFIDKPINYVELAISQGNIDLVYPNVLWSVTIIWGGYYIYKIIQRIVLLNQNLNGSFR